MDEHVVPEGILALQRLPANRAVEHGRRRRHPVRGREGIVVLDAAVHLGLVRVEAALATVLGRAIGALEHLPRNDDDYKKECCDALCVIY